MSKARRETKCIRCWVRWNGQANSPVQWARAPCLAAGDDLADHLGVQRTRAFFREVIGLRAARLVLHDLDDLRDDVAGALDRHGVADPHAEPLDLVLVVQGRVLHHHAADGDRLELGDRRQRAGAADLDLDVADDGRRPLGGELVRDRPARRARHKAETLLPVEAVDLVDDAVDVVGELGTLGADVGDERRAAPRPRSRSATADWSQSRPS